MSRRHHTLVAVAFFGSLFVPVLQATQAVATNANARPDFDNDGFADLVIPDPYANVNAASEAGGVHVLYGSSTGPRALGSQFWTQDSPGVPNVAEANDNFGLTWAAGDFNGDNRDDLAIGAPNEDVGGVIDAGLLVVLYGTSGGLRASGAHEFHESWSGIPDSAESSDKFTGFSMAAGDFDGNGRDDLAIASPLENVGALSNAGAVFVLYGTLTGLSSYGSDMLTQNTAGVPGLPEAAGQFGAQQIAVGDFDSDGRDDLVVPLFAFDVGAATDAGGFYVLYGTNGGLTGSGSTFFTEATLGVPGTAQTDDSLARANAAGDFDGDGYDDVAVGAPGETIGGDDNAGEVYVFYGGSGGISTSGIQRWNQDTAGVTGAAEVNDSFGFSGLAAADFDGDNRDDLAVAVSGEDVGALGNAGSLAVIYGSTSGLTANGNQQFTQNSPGIADQSESADSFTEVALSIGDFDGDGKADLMVPVPYEDLSGLGDAGAAHVLFGASGGLTGSGSMFITRNTAGITGVNTAYDFFSYCCYY